MVTKDVTACGREARNMNFQTAVSARIEIRMFTGSANNPIYFLLHYQVVGCADIVGPPGSWVKRNGDTVQVGCDSVQRTWHLTCRGVEWAGDIGNCQSTADELTDTSWNVQSALEKASTTTEGILAVIGLGVIIGVILGCSMLLLVVTIFKRRRRLQELQAAAVDDELRQHHEQLYYSTDVTGKRLLQSTFSSAAEVKGHHQVDQSTMYGGGRMIMSTGAATEFAAGATSGGVLSDSCSNFSSPQQRLTRQLLGPTSVQSIPPLGLAPPPPTTNYHCDHMYESPQFIQQLTT
jgi:hypothetical protein